MNIIKQSTGFIIILAFSLLISGCGGAPASESLLPSSGSPSGGNNPPPSIFPQAVTPPVPVITTANALADRVELDWSDTSTQEDGFIIERDGIQIATTARNISAWIDTTIQPGITYCYAVRSYNPVGQSAASLQKCATVPMPPITKWILPKGAQVRSLAVNQITGELYAAGEIAVKAPNNNLDNNGIIAKFNPDGAQICSKQFGTNTWDVVFDIAMYNGEAYVSWSDIAGAGTVSVFNAVCDEIKSLNIGHVSAVHIVVDQSGIYFNNGIKMDFQGTVSWGPPFPWINYSLEDVIVRNGMAYYVGQSWSPPEQFASGYTAAADSVTGEIIWTSRWGKQVTASGHKVISNSSGIYTFGENLLVVRHDFAGNLLWIYQDTVRTGAFSHIVMDDAAVYAMGDVWNGCGLTKILNDGTVAWQTSVVGRSLAIFNNVLFVADDSNIIYRYDALTGESL